MSPHTVEIIVGVDHFNPDSTCTNVAMKMADRRGQGDIVDYLVCSLNIGISSKNNTRCSLLSNTHRFDAKPS